MAPGQRRLRARLRRVVGAVAADVALAVHAHDFLGVALLRAGLLRAGRLAGTLTDSLSTTDSSATEAT